MMGENRQLRRLGFLTIGLFDPANPAAGHETTLEIIELGERLGFTSAWVRQRHLQFGISSPVAVLAAASQRTRRIELGTAVIPIGPENPLRLAEDLATVDVLSGGRLNPGLSTGTPIHYEDYKLALYPDTWEVEDFGYSRLERLIAFIRGDRASDFSGRDGIVEEFSERVEPHAAGLVDRLWYGAGSFRSVEWAADHGLNLLTSNVIRDGEAFDHDFDRVQAAQIERFRERHPAGQQARVSQGLVVIPTDSATSTQREKYRAYAEERNQRVGVPHGPGGMLFARDLVGTSEEIAAQLIQNAAFRQVEEVAFALPFSFEHEDYVQILHDIAGNLGPLLGWSPDEATVAQP
ncbi:MAG: LLM class flavin-dependent oxidoreductase [Thermomicrobiales bacterium]